jgi:hypothetical protein
MVSEDEEELAAITSFGMALANLLISATPERGTQNLELSSLAFRRLILRRQPFVRLLDLLSLCWSMAIPVIHLRVFPLAQKRMAAMTVRASARSAILLGKDSMYPAQLAFYVAHELAHVMLGHLTPGSAVVDLDSNVLLRDDTEEVEADRFALEFLTGQSQPVVLPRARRYTAVQLARAAIDGAAELAIEPGTLALCFGYSTDNWATANAAMRHIYTEPKPVWLEINEIARRELAVDQINDDARSYLAAILGEQGLA